MLSHEMLYAGRLKEQLNVDWQTKQKKGQTMIAKELKEKIAGGETSALQFKLTWTNNDSIAAEMAAFANGKGGTIVFGVEDKKGTIEGLSYDDIQDLSRRVANIANENILPTLYVYTETVDLDGKTVAAGTYSPWHE